MSPSPFHLLLHSRMPVLVAGPPPRTQLQLPLQ